MNFMKKWRSRSGGFTLVELIVVIAILGILAGVGTVAYSGYVKKTNMAADEQLLAVVNRAFAAACVENGADVYSLDEVPTIVLEGDAGAKTVGDVSLYNDAFDKYFAGNEGSVFKVISYLKFVNGAFVEGNAVYNAILELLLNNHAADIDKLADSIFDDAGMGELMGKVDYASALAASIADGDATGTSKLTQLLDNPDNLMQIARYLGYEPEAEDFNMDAFLVDYDALVYKKMEIMAAGDGYDIADLDESVRSDYEERAANAIWANNAVLVAATKSTFDTSAFVQKLASGEGKSTILSTMNTDTQTALSQSALAYAMYTSYAARNNIDTSNVDIAAVLSAISSEDTSEGSFRYYMTTTEAQTDMAGYLASMNMLDTSASSDPDAVSNILVNGFSDPDLVAMLQQAANSATGN